MDKKKYTQEGMPIISKDTYRTFIVTIRPRDIKEGTFGRDFYRRLKGKLMKKGENPLIIKALDDLLDGVGEGEFCDGAAFGVFFTYELLRQQMVANKLEEELK